MELGNWFEMAGIRSENMQWKVFWKIDALDKNEVKTEVKIHERYL